MSALWVFAVKGESTNRICLCTCTFALWASQCATYQLFSKEICWSSRKSVILRRQLNKNIKFIMLQRRMNNWNIVLDRGIKCLEKMSYVHTSGIGAFYTFGDIFRRTFDRPSGIRWCWYPAETINGSLIYNKRCASAYSGQWPDLHSACSLFDACWWRSHDVLFSVNSVHGLNCNVLLTAQWCAWMKRLWIINLTEARCSLHQTPTSTTPISSGSATGLSRMYRTWMKRLLPTGIEWSVRRIPRRYRVSPGRFLSWRFCRMDKHTEQAERENIPYFR